MSVRRLIDRVGRRSPDAVASGKAWRLAGDEVAADEARLRTVWTIGSALAVSNGVRRAIALAAAVIVARGAGIEEFGRWTLVTACAATLTFAFDLGLSALVTREAAKAGARPRKLLLHALAVRLGIFIPAGAGIAVFAGALATPQIGADAIRLIVVLAGASLAYGCVAAVVRANPQLTPRILAIEAGGAALQCFLMAAVVAAGGGIGPLLAAAIAVQSMQFAVGLAWWWPAAVEREPSAGDARISIRRALPFAITGVVANSQARLGPLLLGVLSTPVELALFGVAARLGDAARVLPHSAFAAALPVMTRAASEGDAAGVQRRLARYVGTFSVAAALLLAIAGPAVAALVFGTAMLASTPAIVWTALALPPALANAARRVSLTAEGAERVALHYNAMTLGIQAIACAALAPAYGAGGAAAAIAIAEATIWWPFKRAADRARHRAARTGPPSSQHRAIGPTTAPMRPAPVAEPVFGGE